MAILNSRTNNIYRTWHIRMIIILMTMTNHNNHVHIYIYIHIKYVYIYIYGLDSDTSFKHISSGTPSAYHIMGDRTESSPSVAWGAGRRLKDSDGRKSA